MGDPRITCRIQPASPTQRNRGVLAFATVTLDGALELDGLVVRAGGAARRVSFPHRAGRSGTKHAVIRVLDAELKARIVAAVLAAHSALEGGQAA